MAAPSRAVPPPSGRPSPSGSAVMSQGAISWGLAGWPNRGFSCACAVPHRASSPAANRSPWRAGASPFEILGIDIAELSPFINRPADDAIGHVIAGRTARGQHLVARPLRVPCLVGGAALQD